MMLGPGTGLVNSWVLSCVAVAVGFLALLGLSMALLGVGLALLGVSLAFLGVFLGGKMGLAWSPSSISSSYSSSGSGNGQRLPVERRGERCTVSLVLSLLMLPTGLAVTTGEVAALPLLEALGDPGGMWTRACTLMTFLAAVWAGLEDLVGL